MLVPMQYPLPRNALFVLVVKFVQHSAVLLEFFVYKVVLLIAMGQQTAQFAPLVLSAHLLLSKMLFLVRMGHTQLADNLLVLHAQKVTPAILTDQL